MNESKTDYSILRLKPGETPTTSHYNRLVIETQSIAKRFGMTPSALATLVEDEAVTTDHWNALVNVVNALDDWFNHSNALVEAVNGIEGWMTKNATVLGNR